MWLVAGTRTALGTLSLLLAASTSGAQIATLHGPRSGEGIKDSTTAARRMTAVLRTLVDVQDSWLARHHRYGRALRRSGTNGVVISPDAGMTVELMYVTAKGWTGRATHVALPGRSCVVYVGDVPESRLPKTRHDGVIPTRERTPACDAP